jgi:hypothetical protein
MAAKRKKTKAKKTSGSRKRTKTARGKRAKAAPRKKRAQPKKAKAAPAPVIAHEPSASDLEEAIAEPLADVSGVFRVSEQIAKAQRGSDEDDDKLFRDPSLVIEIEKLRDKRKLDE